MIRDQVNKASYIRIATELVSCITGACKGVHPICSEMKHVVYDAYYRRTPQTRKHKTWEGDGILVINGSRATLKDQDGRIMYACLEILCSFIINI
jgi:hypothetical protein